MTCVLCGTQEPTEFEITVDETRYLRCPVCDLHFLHPDHRLNEGEERARYDLHQYDENDEGYAKFVAPLIEALGRHVAVGARGLDFGAGRVPVLANWLTSKGYTVTVYDAFFWPDMRALTSTYDFITACEVVEHLYEPGVEFARLRELLAPGGTLLIKTDLWRGQTQFRDWYYRRDPTHVCFYTERTFHWIAEAFGFKTVDIVDRVVCLRTPER